MAGPPVIGISAYDDVAAWRAWKAPAVVVPQTYVAAVADGGGVPIVLPVGGDAAAQVERVDGLVLTGGPDVDPAHYGADAHPRSSPASAARDAHEMALAAAAEARGIPVLAVCRGLQLLNVCRGGTLVQHLPDVVDHLEHGPGPGRYGRHPVAVEPGSHLARALGRTEIEVESAHHQAVDRAGRGLEVVARAPDGTPEAYEDRSAAFVIGVQWHPEAGTDWSLFRALAEAAGS